MASTRIYDNSRWDSAREEVLARDGKCVLSWLGPCSGPLHVHHVTYDEPYNINKLVTLCERHHPSADRLRRFTARWRRCTHNHPYPGGREECERRLNSV